MKATVTLVWRCLLAWVSLEYVYCEDENLFPAHLSPEGTLITNLLTSYSKKGGLYGRPVHNYSHSVPVKMSVQLIQIVDLDEKNQVLKLNLWTTYKWVDEFLRWNPDDYKGVNEIHLPDHKIWTPDVKLYNYVDVRLEEKRDALCIITEDGNVSWIPQGIYMSTCNVDVTTFPFDKQTCQLKFGSWTYDEAKVDLDFDGPAKMRDAGYFVENKAWTVLKTNATRNIFKYSCCPEVYVDLTYQITFRRSATFYTYILILPCCLLTSLTLVLYWIPPESPVKMALGMSIFMAFFVLLFLFESNMPPASESIPILGTYYCLNMILITTATFLNVFVVNLSFYGARAQVPKFLKKVMFRFFAQALCMDNLVKPFLDADKRRLIPPAVPGLGCQNSNDGKWHKNWKGSNELLVRRKEDFEADPQLAEIDEKLTEVNEYLGTYRERLEEKDRKEKITKEWKAIGLIFDRIFFWIYLVTIVVSLAVVFADTRLEEKRDALCIITDDGNVTWIPQGIYMSTCKVDVMTFPFDKQTCKLKFGSWTYDGTKMDLTFNDGVAEMITGDYFVENMAWSVLNTSAVRSVLSYSCCPEFYPDLTYEISFRRSATFYTYILILPCCLLTSLTLVLYWIPPESPVKMSLGMSIFMAFFVLLFLFESNMPPASENIPILGTYYCLNMILITTATFLNVFVVNMSFYGARAPVPEMLKKVLFKFFAHALCMENLVKPFLDADKTRLIPPAVPGMGYPNGNGSKWPKHWKGSNEILIRRKDDLEADAQMAEIDVKLKDINEFLSYYKERLGERDKKEKISKEWKAVGLIFDRIFFWIYLATIIVSLTVVLSVIFMGS